VSELLLRQNGKKFKVLADFDKKKDYGFKIRKQVATALGLLKKGQEYWLNDLILENQNNTTLFKESVLLISVRQVFKHVMRDGKKIGMIEEIQKFVMSFDDFCKLDSVEYMRNQLTTTRIKHPESITKHSGGGTQKSYTVILRHFSEWLNGKNISIKKIVPLGDNLQRVDTVNLRLDTIEDLLKAYQDSGNQSLEVIKIIKNYLMDKNTQSHKSKNYMDNIVYSIKCYFQTNESPIMFTFNSKVNHETVSDMVGEGNMGLLSLNDLLDLLTIGKPTVTQKAIVLCKFQGGMDNTTLADRFNFEAYAQLIETFGTADHNKWNLEKCPVLIKTTRVKVNFPHVFCLDRDAMTALIASLNWREEKTGEPMKVGQALFLNRYLKPYTNRGVGELIPSLAETAQIQEKFTTKYGIRNSKTSHELRDLLKSTLISCGVEAYAAQHLIGHMPSDSYEKESILYPERIREQYMKASRTLNIFTGITNYIANGDESENRISTLESTVHDLKQQKQEVIIEKKGIDEKRIESNSNTVNLIDEMFKDPEMKKEIMKNLLKDPDYVKSLADQIKKSIS
jgi:hypothetical protein